MKSREGVVLILCNAKGQIALQLRDDIPDTWGLFGGWMEAGETPSLAAIRELEEELCIHLSPQQFEFVGTHEEPSRFLAYMFRVTLTDDGFAQAALREGLGWGLFTPDEYAHMNLLPHHRDMLRLFGSIC